MLIKVDKNPEFLRQISDVLKDGLIIALPTDTVYGLAVDGTNNAAVEKLRKLKDRTEKPFTFFIPKSEINKYAIVTKKKIIDYFVPGPITVILKMKPKITLPGIQERVGLRIPQNDFVIALLESFGKPLAVTSANRSGEPDIDSPYEIVEDLTDVKIVIDAGKIISKPSTVLDLTTTPPTILRKGKIPILEIEKVYARKIAIAAGIRFNVLFVCSANTCRSPMAEGVLKTLIDEKLCDVKSAGILPMDGLPAAQNSIVVVKEYGGSISNHRTKTITPELIDWADLILVMEYKHYDAVIALVPESAVKTFMLREYKTKAKYNEVADPVGKPIDAYRATAQEMLPILKALAKDIEKRYRE